MIYKIQIILLSFLIFCSYTLCKHYNYVIEIGNYKISDQLFQLYVNSQIKKGKITDRESFQNWLNNFTNERILIAEAIEQQIDTIDEFQKKYSNIINQFIVGRGGPAFQKIISQKSEIDETNYDRVFKIINNFYHLSSLVIPFDSLGISAVKYQLNNTSWEFLDDIFKRHHDRLKKEYFYYTSLKLLELQEELINLDSDQPYFLSTYNDQLTKIFRLDSVTTTGNFNIEKDKIKILEMLKRYKEESIITRFSSNIIKKSKVILDSANALILLDTLQNKDFIDTKYAFQHHINLLEQNLFRYYHLGELRVIDISDFIDHYNKLLVKTKIYNFDKLILYVNEYILSKYFRYYFDLNNLAEDEKFIINSNHFKEKLLLDFMEKNICKDIIIDKKKLHDKYDKTKDKYKIPDSILVDLYYFRNIEDAEYFYKTNAQRVLNENTIHFTDSIYANIIIDSLITGNNADWPEELMKNLCNVKENSLLYPILINNQYVITHKKEEINFQTKEYDEIKHILFNEVLKEEKSKKISDFITKFKSMNKIINRVEIDKFFKE